MNNISKTLTTLIHYNVVIRDVLQFTFQRDKYDPEAYKNLKRGVIIEVNEQTHLKSILTKAGENGAKLEQQIRDFYEEIFGDKSTILKLADDGVRVDHNQHSEIFKGVLPIHESVTGIILSGINEGKRNGAAAKTPEEKAMHDVSTVEKVWLAEDSFFRGVAFAAVVNDLIRFFEEYQVARREEAQNGGTAAASTFIGKDIEEMIRQINFLRQTSHEIDPVYKNMEDKIGQLVEMMVGRRQVPEGKRIPDVYKDVQETINNYIRQTEAAFNAVYKPLIDEFLESIKTDSRLHMVGDQTPNA